MITCPYCGSGRILSTGGANGDPFNRQKMRSVCGSCGRTLWEEPSLTDLCKPIIRVEATVECREVHGSAKAEFPYKDGTYSLAGEDYPISKFGTLTLTGDVIDIDGVKSKLTPGIKLRTQKLGTVYAIDHVPWTEKIDLTVYIDYTL